MAIYKIQLRRDSATNWSNINPTLSQGEIGYETDTGKLKIGDGLTAWASLSYFSGNSTTTQISGGGTGTTDAQSAIDALSQVSAATNEYVLTKDTATGHVLFKASQGGFLTESGSLDYLTTTANKFAVGANALISTEKFLVNGSTDIIQAIIRAHSTQTANILEVRKSDDTVILAATNTAGITVGGASVSVTSNSTNTALTLTGNGTAGVQIGNALLEKKSALTDGATPALDASLGNIFTLTAAGNRTIATASNTPASGYSQKILIYHTASAAGRTLAFNASGYDVSGITIAQTSSGKTDVFGLAWNEAAAKFYVVAQVQGYA